MHHKFILQSAGVAQCERCGMYWQTVSIADIPDLGQCLIEHDRDANCKHLGKATDSTVECLSCGPTKRTLFACNIHSLCQPFAKIRHMQRATRTDFQLCCTCDEYEMVSIKQQVRPPRIG